MTFELDIMDSYRKFFGSEFLRFICNMVILQGHVVRVLYLLFIKLLEIKSKISFMTIHHGSIKMSINYILKFYSYF